ncbi:hypothetical protein OH76DRAFT_1064454 [Lentinus brumalis]|uniref:Uncharacterized protein n=1 Tax=Lentinus brumalis TaxID=2498619 RepID=A0A371DNJ2_9APHY|nr:hypothetical protein OH76DRAFT_1064454 [Polyporus brumalis]
MLALFWSSPRTPRSFLPSYTQVSWHRLLCSNLPLPLRVVARASAASIRVVCASSVYGVMGSGFGSRCPHGGPKVAFCKGRQWSFYNGGLGDIVFALHADVHPSVPMRQANEYCLSHLFALAFRYQGHQYPPALRGFHLWGHGIRLSRPFSHKASVASDPTHAAPGWFFVQMGAAGNVNALLQV